MHKEESDTVSALADDALHGAALADALEHVLDDAQALSRWHAYHLIGDVLRSPLLAEQSSSTDFLARLEARLAQEPTISRPVLTADVPSSVPPALQRRPAANRDVFRWKVAAGFASVAAVAAIGWGTVTGLSNPGSEGAVWAVRAPAASAGQVLQASTDAGGNVMLRNPQLDDLLAAHDRAVGGAALQSQAGFVRSASFETAQPQR